MLPTKELCTVNNNEGVAQNARVGKANKALCFSGFRALETWLISPAYKRRLLDIVLEKLRYFPFHQQALRVRNTRVK